MFIRIITFRTLVTLAFGSLLQSTTASVGLPASLAGKGCERSVLGHFWRNGSPRCARGACSKHASSKEILRYHTINFKVDVILWGGMRSYGTLVVHRCLVDRCTKINGERRLLKVILSSNLRSSVSDHKYNLRLFLQCFVPKPIKIKNGR